jgi:mitochondrial enoyl-[acyl-carrier protein] reductase / trans-2-enoyl-CoA reductase
VNPADINTIQGKYPSRPPLPAVAGNEGVGEIVEVGANVQNLRIGDRVVPNGPNFGIWRTQANYNFKDVMKVCALLLHCLVIIAFAACIIS